MLYWEDIATQAPFKIGPKIVTVEALNQLLLSLGEHEQYLMDSSPPNSPMAERCLIPPGIIHAITTFSLVSLNDKTALVGMRNMAWNFFVPLYADVPFFIRSEHIDVEAVNEEVGLITSRRTILSLDGNAYAIGRVNHLFLRKAASGRD